MKNFILSLAFMLIGTFAFANTGNIKNVQFEPTQEVKASVIIFEDINNLDIAEKADFKFKFVRKTNPDGSTETRLEIEW